MFCRSSFQCLTYALFLFLNSQCSPHTVFLQHFSLNSVIKTLLCRSIAEFPLLYLLPPSLSSPAVTWTAARQADSFPAQSSAPLFFCLKTTSNSMGALATPKVPWIYPPSVSKALELVDPASLFCSAYLDSLSQLCFWHIFSSLLMFSSVQFSRSFVSDSFRPHELQHTRPPCPSPTPRVHSDSSPSSRWCHPAISSSVVLFSSCPQSLPASESFSISQLFAWGGWSTGVSALASFLPKNTQGWSPSEWTGWISVQSKGLSRVFSNTTVQKHQFFSAQLSSQSNSHFHTWSLKKT